jgi:hypothetical protein
MTTKILLPGVVVAAAPVVFSQRLHSMVCTDVVGQSLMLS